LCYRILTSFGTTIASNCANMLEQERGLIPLSSIVKGEEFG
jgi:hypothetical protein